MVNKYAVVKWSFFSSVTQKQAIACFCVFSIACIFSSITMPSISYLVVLLSLFDGYRLDGLNIPEFLRYVILRLAPIYLISFSFSASIERDSYFRVRLYKCSEWKKTIEYAALLVEALFVVLQIVTSLAYFFSSPLQGQGMTIYGDNLIVCVLPLITFLEIYMSILLFFNVYFLSKNSVFSFLLLFFLYLISAIWNIPFYPFGLSAWVRIQYLTPDLAASFISAALVLFVAILILHQLLNVSVKKFLLR